MHEESPPWHFEASNIFKQSSRRWILRLHLLINIKKRLIAHPRGSLFCTVIPRMGWYIKIFDLCNTLRPFLEEKDGKWRNRGSQLHLLTPVSVSQPQIANDGAGGLPSSILRPSGNGGPLRYSDADSPSTCLPSATGSPTYSSCNASCMMVRPIEAQNMEQQISSIQLPQVHVGNP